MSTTMTAATLEEWADTEIKNAIPKITAGNGPNDQQTKAEKLRKDPNPYGVAAAFDTARICYTSAIKKHFQDGQDEKAVQCHTKALGCFKEHDYRAGISALDGQLDRLRAEAAINTADTKALTDSERAGTITAAPVKTVAG